MPSRIWILCLALLVLGAGSAHALIQTFTVTSTGDEADDNTGDGLCHTSAGTCTLRAAVQQANAGGVPVAIHFNVTGTGCTGSPATCTIQPASDLPSLTV